MANGGITDIGRDTSQLNIGGEFTQQSGSTLSVTIGATPDIVANTAVLDGTLVISGFVEGQPPVKASEVITSNYTLIHTTNGITGNFTNNPLDPVVLDYLLHQGHISADGLDYNLGFQLAWTQGGQAQGTGNFTLAAGTAFDIDQALTDQTGPFTSGWDGKSLTKNGDGLLVLSTVAQQYTGSTLLNAGTLRTDVLNAFASSEAVTVNGGLLDLNGNNQTAHNLSGTSGEVRLTNGAELQLDNTTTDTTYAGSITDSGSLLKVGDGMLTLTGDASHSGLTTIDAGTLSIGNGGTTGTISSDIANNATLIFNRSDANDYTGVLSGEGDLFKQAAGELTLSGGTSHQGSVEVQAGTLTLKQNGGSLTTTGDYTTYNGATTVIGLQSSTLNVGGEFTQQSGSALNVTIGATPDIVANTAVLDGTLVVSGFDDAQPPVKASEVITSNYTLIQTTNGITGDFTNNPLDPIALDYLLREGHISADGNDYNLGFQMAWTQGGEAQGTGNFTLAAGTAFDIDQALTDQTGPFTSGWDGKSLTKAGEGLLVLSTVAQQYTGSTMLNAGTLRTDVLNAFASSEAVTVNGGLLDLNGNNQTAHNLSGTSGEVRLTNGAELQLDNTTTDTTYAGSITDSGSLLKVGDGMLTLTGDASHSGLTTIDAGTLSIGNGGTTGTISSDI
ncbi:autotransporter-associated beta strand repeat-containing protein, partial [Serratia sp. DD3]|uniref:autotransporter-associated beta strand repeat-containing protein n=1 Tax=Serratia sp. DD3 TaxID=1410619 RepID=UPI00056B72C3